MTFYGTLDGFPQQYFKDTLSPFCPKSVLKEAAGLVRSPVEIADIRKDIKKYNNKHSKSPKFKHALLRKVIEDAMKCFVLPKKVRPIHLNDIPQKSLDYWDSSPGIPWKLDGFKTRRAVAKDPNAFQSVRRFWYYIKKTDRKIILPDCTALVRPHIVKKGRKKVRVVWGYPSTVLFQEACFALPLIKAYELHDNPIAFGFKPAQGGCRKIVNRFGAYSNFLSSDFKEFDKTVPAWLIQCAFKILACNINWQRYEGWGIPDKGCLERVWDRLVSYFINTPIRMCTGKRFKKSHGLPSGSYFTQLVGSIVNYIVIQYCVRAQKVRVFDILVYGDDSLVATNHRVNVDRLVEDAKQFGMVINSQKTNVFSRIQQIKFLGYNVNNGNPSKPSKDLYAALLYPERPDGSFDDFATRTLTLMIAIFGADPNFHDRCMEILQTPYRIVYSPIIMRFLKILGIEQLPDKLPSLKELRDI